MILIEPEEGIADEEIPHFVAAVVEDERAPILVFGLAGVGVFVQVGAVELGQTMRVLGKMAGNPVQNDANAALVEGLSQLTVRSAETARRYWASGGRADGQRGRRLPRS